MIDFCDNFDQEKREKRIASKYDEVFKECQEDVMSSYTAPKPRGFAVPRKKGSQEKKKALKDIDDSDELYTAFINSKQDAHEFSAQLTKDQKDMFHEMHAKVQQQIKER